VRWESDIFARKSTERQFAATGNSPVCVHGAQFALREKNFCGIRQAVETVGVLPCEPAGGAVKIPPILYATTALRPLDRRRFLAEMAQFTQSNWLT
jgi:hypothetical protein